MHRGLLANGVRLAMRQSVLFGFGRQQAGRQASVTPGGSDVLVIRRRAGRQRWRLPDAAAKRPVAGRAIVGADLWGAGGEKRKAD